MEQLEQIIGYTFQNKKLLKQALTHSSYANEKKLGKLGCNERLEFLGDAVLELISSDFLYAKFTQVPEGELTKKRASLVCEPSLAYCARQFGLPQYLLLGKGENMTGGRNRDSIVSDATEALLGAIYLDGGFEPAKDFVLKFILNDIEHKQLFYDSKTIPYKRGDILDRNGTKIATSERVYNVILDVVVMTDKEEYIDPTIKVLNKCFGISEKTVREIVEEKPNSRYVILKKGIDYETEI